MTSEPSKAGDLPQSPAFGNAAEWMQVARRRMRAGDTETAAAAAFEATRDPLIKPDTAMRVGRMMAKVPSSVGSERIVVRIYAQCTVDSLADVLPAVAWREQVRVEVIVAPFDSVLSSLDTAGCGSDADVVNVNVLFPWSTRLLARTEIPFEERIEDEIAFWEHAWKLTAALQNTHLLQVGYDTEFIGSLGVFLGRQSGPRRTIEEVNQRLVELLPAHSYFVDLPAVAAQTGYQHFYDPRRDHLAKQPFSDVGAVAIAEHVWAGIRALVTGPKKVIVTDLDNTLWGGVVGEVGSQGITLGDDAAGRPFLAYQRYLKQLSARGCVLAVCSKNNADDAGEPFGSNPKMLLRRDDFAAFEAGWDAKPVAIERISQQLNLGLEHFVFVDDHPAERHAVRAALPQVSVPELPEDPSEYVRTIEHGLWFEAVSITGEDGQRADMYRQQNERGKLRKEFTSTDDYVASLQLVGTTSVIDDSCLERVVQLVGKTNQFNLTTRRHTRQQVCAIIDEPSSIGLTVSISDRYGDYGLVAVMLGVRAPEDGTIVEIDTWLMSCRVIGRTVEQFTMSSFSRQAIKQGYRTIRGIFVPTPKNSLVKDLYPKLGFNRKSVDSDEVASFEAPIASIITPTAVAESD